MPTGISARRTINALRVARIPFILANYLLSTRPRRHMVAVALYLRSTQTLGLG